MFSSELNARAQRLVAEQKAQAEKQKQKQEKERLLQERQRQREQQREDEAQRKRTEQLESEQRARDAEFELRERNRGVYLCVELQALPADEAAVQAKGVRRSKDKLILPPSVGASLLGQDASKNGAMLFEVALPEAPRSSAPSASTSYAAAHSSSAAAVAGFSTSAAGTSGASTSSSGRTHAGVLEFTAPEGTVLLPRKVCQSLWGSLDAAPGGRVVVTYVLLDKGSYVRLQPMSHGFHEAMADELREVLEAELMGHSTLSEGDWITVSHAGTGLDWPLRVQELRPSPAVSVLDTDMEADVVPSLEAEEYLARWEQEQRAAQERLAALAAERAEREAAAASAAERRQAAAAATAAAAAAAREALRERLAAALPAEPAAASTSSSSGSGSALHVFTCAFSLPDGTRVTRRFTSDQPAQLLFDFIDSRGAGGWVRGSYQLVTRIPRRVVGPAEATAGRTLGELGLGQGGEAFLLEALARPAEEEGGQGTSTGAAMEVDGASEGMATA